MAVTVKRQSTELNFEIDKGSSFRHQITWKTGPAGSELPVDLTGCTAQMQIRSRPTSPDVLHELTTENGGITLGDATGTIDLFISDEDSTAFTWKDAVYGLEITFVNTDVRRLLRGKIKAYDETTK